MTPGPNTGRRPDALMLDQYLKAATRQQTRRSYRAGIEHFEAEWGGFLPATADSIARYLASYAGQLAVNTLKLRLAALAQWHIDQGFPDPTKAPVVKKVLKGIQALHPAQEKRAKPLQLEQLEGLVSWLDQQLQQARQADHRPTLLKYSRDKALLLVGFWRAFRSDELSRLRVEDIEVVAGEGMTLFLTHTKGDCDHRGTTFRLPLLSRLCPVTAYQEWIAVASLSEGPVFRRIDQWGHLGAEALHANSLIPLLRKLFRAANLPAPDSYSSHSLRRGFATWAHANQWDVKMLMEYVGWKDMKSALRYIQGSDPFARQWMEAGLAATVPPTLPAPLSVLRAPEPEQAPLHDTPLELQLLLEPFRQGGRGRKRARQAIETCCLQQHRMQAATRAGHYRIAIRHASAETLEESIDSLLDEMHQIAGNHDCYVEICLTDPASGQNWS